MKRLMSVKSFNIVLIKQTVQHDFSAWVGLGLDTARDAGHLGRRRF